MRISNATIIAGASHETKSLLILAATFLFASCGGEEVQNQDLEINKGEYVKSDGKDDSSAHAIFLDMAFHGNTFVPGQNADLGEENWKGLEEEDRVVKGEQPEFETEAPAAGKYTFTLSGEKDVDLYIRVGLKPTFENYDCRPYKAGAEENCMIELAGSSKIHIMIDGYEGSTLTLRGALKK